MEIRNIVTFLRVAELGSFTRAADELGYVQSTVTAQIKQLEYEIGAPLFDRIAKKIRLTQTGNRLMPYARELLRLAEEAASINTAPSEVDGLLRAGGLESLYTWDLAEKLRIYHIHYPYVRIETRVATRHELYKMLKHGELDMIYLLDKKNLKEGLICAFSAPVEMIFITYPENPIAKLDSIELAEIARQPLILTEPDGVYRKELEGVASENNLILVPFLEVNNTSIIERMIRSGMGVSLLPDYAVIEGIGQGKLCRLNVPECRILLWRQIFYHRNKWVTPQMSRLISIIEQS